MKNITENTIETLVEMGGKHKGDRVKFCGAEKIMGLNYDRADDDSIINAELNGVSITSQEAYKFEAKYSSITILYKTKTNKFSIHANENSPEANAIIARIETAIGCKISGTIGNGPFPKEF